MARHATWIRRPEDPTTPVGWLFWREVPLADAQRRCLKFLIPFAVAVTAMALAVAGATAFFTAGVATIVGLGLYVRPGAREIPTLSTTGEHNVFPVALDVRNRRGRPLGHERGWIAFAEGWLIYEGPRTAFSLDVHSTEGTDKLGSLIRLRLPGGGSVFLTLLNDSSRVDRASRGRASDRLDAEFRRWRTEPPPSGEPMMPPCELHPAAYADLLVVPCGVCLGGIGGLILSVFWGLPLLAMACGLAIALALAAVAWTLHRLDGRLQTLHAPDPRPTPRFSVDQADEPPVAS